MREKKERKKRGGSSSDDDGLPPKPKKPMGGYFTFANRNREAIKRELMDEGKEEKECGMGPVAKRTGAKWEVLKDTDPEELAAVMEEVEQDKQRYEEECEAYEKEHGEGTAGRKKKKQKRSGGVSRAHPEAPKRPCSGYFLFLNRMRPEITEELRKRGVTGREAMTQVATIAAPRWNKAKEENTTVYQEIEAEAAKLKEEYQVKLTAFIDKYGAEALEKRKVPATQPAKKRRRARSSEDWMARESEDSGGEYSSDGSSSSSSSSSDSSSSSSSSSSGGGSSSSSSSSSGAEASGGSSSS